MVTIRPKIAHLLYSGLGGHGSVFFSLINADSNKRFSYLAVFCGIEPLSPDYADLCERRNIAYSYFSKKKGLDIAIYVRLWRYFRREKPDYIFLHGVAFILPALAYCFFSRKKKVFIRDTQAHHLKSRMEWLWLFVSMQLGNRIIILTNEAAKGIKKKFKFFYKKNKIVIIPNGLDISMFSIKKKYNETDEFRIGMQSRLQPIKDHPTLIRAFKIVCERKPDLNLSLHIAGDGSTKSELESLVKETNLSDKVNFHGMLATDELLDFMHKLDVYVHATFGETQSNSIMQAMACGLPIIASNVSGVNNMLQHNVNGLLYSSEDMVELAELIIYLVDNKQKRTELGEHAKNLAIQRYSNEAMFNRYSELIGL